MLKQLAEKTPKPSTFSRLNSTLSRSGSTFSRSSSLLSENSDSRDSSENDVSMLSRDESMLSTSGSMLNSSGSMQHAEVKEKAYQERRRKNNLAAKRSRDARRAKEDEINIRAAFLGIIFINFFRGDVCFLSYEFLVVPSFSNFNIFIVSQLFLNLKF